MIVLCMALLAGLAGMQEPAAKAATPATEATIIVPTGTRVPLQLINRVSTKNAAQGDQVYMQTAYPVIVDNHVVIPPGSYVRATVTQVKRPGRVAGRGEIYIRFDSLTLPNGVTRDFLGRVGAVEGSGSETLDKKEGKIQADTAKGHDAGTIASTAAAGASIGTIAGAAAGGHPLGGLGIGSAAGAAAGIAMVLLTRGPEAILERGSTVDMVLDRQLAFRDDELRFNGGMNLVNIVPSGATQNQSGVSLPLPGRIPHP